MIGNFGVTDSGLLIKRIPDIIDQMKTSLAADLGADFDLLSVTPEGQLINRQAEELADLWELAEQVYNSLFVNTASGISLQNARSLTNSFIIPATASVANGVIITGVPGTLIQAGFKLSVDGSPASIFQTVADVTVGGGGTVAAAFVCVDTGPTRALAGKLTNIVNSLPGIASATNPTDAQLGTNVESDAAFRIRSAQELNRPGTGTYSGLLQFVQKVANVSQVFEFINDLDFVDANGLAPHSVQLIVIGGIDQDIANAIFAAKGAGIETNGTTVCTVVDSQGVSHTIKFSRLTDLPIYMDVTLSINSNPASGPVFPGNGNNLALDAIVAFGDLYLPGQTVITTGFFTPINTVPGVTGATILISTSPGPSGSANIPVPIYQVAQFLAANISVHQ